MSMPGGQPNPYQQPPPIPAQPPAMPGHPPTVAVPAEPPYPQQQQPAPGFGAPAPFPQPPGPPQPGGRRGRGVLWALVGALVASAAWAGGLFATGNLTFLTGPDLGGYAYTKDLCKETDLKPFEKNGLTLQESTSEDSPNPQPRSLTHADLDSMQCQVAFDAGTPGTDGLPSSSRLYLTAERHKATDPGPEFTARQQHWKQYSDDEYTYSVKPVSGVGDEAYLITYKSKDGTASGSGDAWVVLAVRDGWLTYESTFSQYLSDSTTGGPDQIDDAKAARMLQDSAESSLAKLRD
ncbi:hypothetical protein AB0M28_04010 [Streptomyces sp. NPDC051940]|uniref:hypothetical protein n=1 Tax=Streptomyces sp. NPDC051940 TaxID=3155675 RepID=UPI00344ABA32